jgi:LL-diaminopimelate aminotransferase
MSDFQGGVEALSQSYFATQAPKIQSLRAEGVDVIRLDIGSPDLPPPAEVIEVLARSAREDDHHGYQHYRGIPALRAAWADFYLRNYEVKLDPEVEILPLTGSKEGIFHIGRVALRPGDKVLLPDPGYLTYISSTVFSGGEPYYMPLSESHGYLPILEDIPEMIASKAKILWLNYPHNPTGAVADLDFFTAAVEFAREHEILLIHDAAYTQVTFDGYRAPSVLEVPEAKEVAIEFNTLSKSHNMAGWRVGAAVGNADVLDKLYQLKTHVDSGQFLPVMEAATAALNMRGEWFKTHEEVFQRRRDLVVDGLTKVDARFLIPQAGIYAWFCVPASMTSLQFVEELREGTGVCLAPGSIFGKHGEGYARLAFCAPEARLAEAMSRMVNWWRQNARSG